MSRATPNFSPPQARTARDLEARVAELEATLQSARQMALSPGRAPTAAEPRSTPQENPQMTEMVKVTMHRCVSCGAEALADTPVVAFPHYRNCPKLAVAAFCKPLDKFKPLVPRSTPTREGEVSE